MLAAAVARWPWSGVSPSMSPDVTPVMTAQRCKMSVCLGRNVGSLLFSSAWLPVYLSLSLFSLPPSSACWSTTPCPQWLDIGHRSSEIREAINSPKVLPVHRIQAYLINFGQHRTDTALSALQQPPCTPPSTSCLLASPLFALVPCSRSKYFSSCRGVKKGSKLMYFM